MKWALDAGPRAILPTLVGTAIGALAMYAVDNYRVNVADGNARARQSETDSARQEVRNVERTMAALKSDRDTLSAEIVSLTAARDEAKRQIVEQVAAARNGINGEIVSLNQEIDKLKKENASLQGRIDKLTRPPTSRATQTPQPRFANARDSLAEVVKHLNEMGVPRRSALSILGGRYTITADSGGSLDSQICMVTVSDTTAAEGDSSGVQRKNILLGGHGDFTIDGHVVTFVFRSVGNPTYCQFDVTLH